MVFILTYEFLVVGLILASGVSELADEFGCYNV